MIVAAEPPWPPADPAAVSHWKDLRFGMFIHWGPVSLTGHEISWSRGRQIPVDVYDNLYRKFNPTEFNADAWVSVAKAAGMKYIVLTAKHHDGFCLWNTKYTDYNIMNTPFHRDVVKELAAACKKQGIEFGCYYSVPDVYNPNWPMTVVGGGGRHPNANVDTYATYLRNQITELIQNYGPLITIWNDTDQALPGPFGVKNGAETIKLVRKLQPDILIDNRTSAGGDYDTPEQTVGGFQLDRPWESCMTVSSRNAWAWGGATDGVKSPATCISMLVRCAGGDGNMMLNVGPRPDGVIDPAQAGVLKEIGVWLGTNGESIYGTRGGPYKPGEFGVSTRKGKFIYLHVLKWTGEALRLPAIPDRRVVSAKVLGGSDVACKQSAGLLEITVPEAQRQSLDTIVELVMDQPVEKIAPLDSTAPSIFAIDPEKYGHIVSRNAVVTTSSHYGAAAGNLQSLVGEKAAGEFAFHTNQEANPWVDLDLGRVVTVAGLLVKNREQFKERASALHASVSLDGEKWEEIWHADSPEEQWEIPVREQKARYLRLELQPASPEYLHLRQVEVWGKE